MKITVGELRQLIRETIEENDANLDEGWKDIVDKGKKFIKKWLPVATISLASVGCNVDSDRFKCEGFTEEEIAIMQAAADEWCEKTNNVHCAVMGNEGDSDIQLVAFIDDERNVTGQHFSVRGGKNHPSFITIKDRRTSPEWEAKLYSTVMHELGHHFSNQNSGTKSGKHLKNHEDGVMATRGHTDYVTDKDIAYIKGKLSKDDLN